MIRQSGGELKGVSPVCISRAMLPVTCSVPVGPAMDLIQGIWPAWLGLEKRDFKFSGTGASTSVPFSSF